MTNIPIAQPVFIMRPIEDLYDYQNIVIYGDYGDGKTYLAATSVFVPEMHDILYISLEGGEKTLKEIHRLCLQQNIDPNCIMVVPVQTFQQYSYIYEFLKIHVEARDRGDLNTLRKLEAQVRGFSKEDINDVEKLRELIPQPRQFRTVITDSLTEAQKYCMYQILGIDPLKHRIDAEPDQAQFQDWGKSREMIQFLVRRFRDLPVHCIFICGQDIEQDARKQFHYDLMLPGKLAKDVRGLVDTVGYLRKIPQEGGQVVRRLFLEGGFHGGAYIAAKNRYGTKLKGLWIDNPTMKDLYELGKS